jgi:hypothetical protein
MRSMGAVSVGFLCYESNLARWYLWSASVVDVVCHDDPVEHNFCQDVLAPYTGAVRMASNDTNYSLQDFKRLSEALTASLQAAFPDRAVRVFSYGGDTK